VAKKVASKSVENLGPSKVAIFSWQLLQDRLPTRQNIWYRAVIVDGSASTCVFCGLRLELTGHLFSSCNQISQVWYGIFRWLGVVLMPPRGVLEFF
jgi:hypothetical protein